MLFSFPTVALAAHSWETVRMERLGEGKVVSRTSEIEVRTLRGTILVYTSRPTQVKGIQYSRTTCFARVSAGRGITAVAKYSRPVYCQDWRYDMQSGSVELFILIRHIKKI